MLTPKPRRHLDLTTVTLTNMLLFPHATLNVERVAAYWTRLCGVGEFERGCGVGGHACAPRMQGKYCRLCPSHGYSGSGLQLSNSAPNARHLEGAVGAAVGPHTFIVLVGLRTH